MKNTIFLVVFLFACNGTKETLKQTTQIKIDNYNNQLVFNKKNDSVINISLQGYDLGDSRYISSFDEKNKNIKLLYETYNLNEFNSNKTFRSVKNDTIYTFPLSEQSPNKLFSKNYSATVLHKFYLSVYKDKKNGQVIIIDSIR